MLTPEEFTVRFARTQQERESRSNCFGTAKYLLGAADKDRYNSFEEFSVFLEMLCFPSFQITISTLLTVLSENNTSFPYGTIFCLLSYTYSTNYPPLILHAMIVAPGTSPILVHRRGYHEKNLTITDANDAF